jgi:quercetin dioxygenase-like cupin family protein
MESHAVGLVRQYEGRTIDVRPDPQIPVDGATLGVAAMSRNSPHGGERHLDGDEVLYLISGLVRVVFLESSERDIEMVPGTGLIVPRGVWHRVDFLKPSQIVYLTPGPNNEYRELDEGT